MFVYRVYVTREDLGVQYIAPLVPDQMIDIVYLRILELIAR